MTDNTNKRPPTEKICQRSIAEENGTNKPCGDKFFKKYAEFPKKFGDVYGKIHLLKAYEFGSFRL